MRVSDNDKRTAARCRFKEYMNLQTIGASKRPKLSLHYGKAPDAPPEREISSLSDHELRRIVAGMIG